MSVYRGMRWNSLCYKQNRSIRVKLDRTILNYDKRGDQLSKIRIKKLEIWACDVSELLVYQKIKNKNNKITKNPIWTQ